MKKTLWKLIPLSLLASTAFAAEPPPDLAIDPQAPVKTLAPRMVPNSGRLEWTPHHVDLSQWPSLSYQDQRSTPLPRKVELKGAVNGDAKRGREIAMSKKGLCVNCHELPGDDWPGTFGNSLLHYKRNKMPDAIVYQQIFDARLINPYSVMPPFGTFGLLSEQDIRDLVAFVQGIE